MEILSWLQNAMSDIGPFFILLGLLIFVHELGHFLVAKFYNVRVEVFSLGFGKKIFQFKHGETTYCISIIPLGGYVKMYGDDPSAEIPEAEKKRSFLHKPVGQRIAIVLAGPLMNLFFAGLLFSAIAMVGQDILSSQVGDIKIDSPAGRAGFRAGDKIVKINDQEISNWDQVNRLVEKSANKELIFSITRDRQSLDIQAIPKLVKNPNILSTKAKVGQIEGLVVESQSSLVGLSDPNSLAGRAGIKPLDLILSVNGHEVSFWRELGPRIKTEIQKSKQLNLKVRAYEVGKADAPERNHVIDTSKLNPELSAAQLVKQVGLESPDLYLLKVRPDSPADKAGLRPGDKILALDSEQISNWDQVIDRVKSYEVSQSGIEFKIGRAGKELNLNIVPEMTSLMNNQGQDEERYTVGIVAGYIYTPPPAVLFRTSNPFEAVMIGVRQSIEMTGMMVVGIARLITGDVSTKNIGGVISIGRFASHSFEAGISQFMRTMALISINLFLINLLPVPILDGGHLVFFTIEALRGAPISMRKMEIAQQVGLVILMSLMALSLFNDITSLLNTW